MKATILDDNIHVWVGTNNKIMVSHESTKNLESFPTVDDAINGLFLTGFKQAARELNKHKDA